MNGLTNEEINKVAKACHEVNRAFCQAHGDNSQVKWEDAPGWQRRSAFMGVRFKLENPDVTPEDMHNSWLEQKEKDGWVYGDVKDVEKKTHPAMVPYKELPADQKAKDILFSAVVESFRAEVLGEEEVEKVEEVEETLESILMSKKRKELEEEYPNIAELKPANKNEFVKLVIAQVEKNGEEEE